MTKAYELPETHQILNLLARDIAQWSINKGFWQNAEDLVNTMITKDCTDHQAHFASTLVKCQKILLMVSELGELTEELRKPAAEDVPGYENEVIELADVVIRILDYCGYYGLPLGEAIMAKMAKNEGRPYMHGKGF